MSVESRPQAPAGTSRLNGALLCCNLALLLVNLLLALRTGDAGAARSDAAARDPAAGQGLSLVAMPCSRVLQTLSSAAPGDEPALLTGERLHAVLDAVTRYRETIERGLKTLLHAPAGTDLGLALAELDRDARDEVEVVLGTKFRDAALVQRLATEVIRSSR